MMTWQKELNKFLESIEQTQEDMIRHHSEINLNSIKRELVLLQKDCKFVEIGMKWMIRGITKLYLRLDFRSRSRDMREVEKNIC